MKEKWSLSRLAVVLLWAGFSTVTALAMMAIQLGAEPGTGLLRHLTYAVLFGGTGLWRGLLVALSCLTASVLWGRSLPKSGRVRISGILLALFFAWNTLIWLSPREPKALEYLLVLPGVRWGEMLLFYAQLTGNYYGMIAAVCLWLNGRGVGKASPAKDRRLLFGGIILLGWLPVLVLRSPGSLYMDTAIQILMYQGNYHFHASMPVLLTVVYGALFDLGKWLAGDNGGLLACMLVQTGLLLYAMAEACQEAATCANNWKTGLLLSLFFGCVPVFPTMAQGLIKDSIHGAVYLLFVIWFFRCVRGGGWMPCLLLGILAAATRKGGVFLAALSLALLAVCRQDLWKKLLLSGVLLVVGSIVTQNLIYPMFGIEKPWQRENYSFFYPITAYYCQMHSQEMTQEEIQAVSDVLDFDTACTGYSTIMVDDVKNTFHAENPDQVRRFLLQNGKFFLKHPITCLEAVVYSKNLYYTPFSLGGQTLYATQASLGGLSGAAQSGFSFFLPEPLRREGEDFLEEVQNFLPVRLLCGPGLYSWLWGILLLAALWDRRKQMLWALAPVGLLTVGLLLSHINGAVRYALPQMLCIPFLLAIYPAGKRPKE